MAVTVPSFIPTPFASEGQFAVIPEVPSSEQGRASWQQGFPQVCAQPLASGGIPPNYQDFQGIFNALSAAICYMQTGALWPWSASLTYPLGAHVLGSDNQEYVALQESTGKDPTTDTTQTYWEPGITNTSVFTPPTASEPGKEGLVPQPQATDPSVQINNILTMQGWKKISSAAMIPDEESGELIQGMGSLLDPVDLNDIFSGNYYLANIIANAPNNEKTGNILVWKTEVGTCFQVFIRPSGIFVRGSSTATGQLVWGSWDVFGAPKPKDAEGVGKWARYDARGGTNCTLPAEGVWAYHIIKRSLPSCGINALYCGVAAGGTILDTQADSTVDYVGLVWQVSA